MSSGKQIVNLVRSAVASLRAKLYKKASDESFVGIPQCERFPTEGALMAKNSVSILVISALCSGLDIVATFVLVLVRTSPTMIDTGAWSNHVMVFISDLVTFCNRNWST